MVKDSKPKKPSDDPPRRRRKRAVTPDAVRSERLILRVHPDLLEMLEQEAEANGGMTRSVYVEQILLGWINRGRRKLDHRGRRLPSDPPPSEPPLITPAAFETGWRGKAGIRLNSLLQGREPGDDEDDSKR